MIAASQRKLSAAVLSTVGKTEPLFPVVSDSGAPMEVTKGLGASIATAVAAGGVVADAETIVRRLSQQPLDVRNAARALSDDFRAQIEELNRYKPNDAASLTQHESLVALFERMASGLSDLADALDNAISNAKGGKPEPTFLGRAGEIARQLNLGLMEWLAENRTLVIDIPLRVGLFGLGVAFLHSIGADSTAAIAGLTALALKRAPQTRARSANPKRRSGPQS
jgi:hypothetical protein